MRWRLAGFALDVAVLVAVSAVFVVLMASNGAVRVIDRLGR